MSINVCDIRFIKQIWSISDIIKCMKEDRFIYETDGNVDSHILEFMLICPQTYSINMYLRELPDCNFKVYGGQGLLRTLNYYLLSDVPIEDFKILTELNGKSFSEFPNQYKRRIMEYYINGYYDDYNVGTNDDIVIKDYLRMLENCI